MKRSFFRDKLVLKAPLCARHRNHWVWHSVLIFGGVAVWFAFALVSFWLGPTLEWDKQTTAVVIVVAFVLWAVAAVVVHETSINQKGVTPDGVTLNGVSARFVQALERHRG